MATRQGKARQKAQRSAAHDPLTTVTFRGRLIPGQRDGFLELDTPDARYELLGPFDSPAYEGEDVEIEGIPAPATGGEEPVPALLVRHVRRL